LELIEERAREVFDDLHRLERVIVLFDECDELFRARGPTEASEQMRSITAFVTASMLPKLQRLHDDGRVVFFICTNNFPHLDPAIKRRGRIDHIVAVGPPDEHARKRLVQAELGAAVDASSMNRLWTATERFTRSELMHLLRLFRHRLEQLADRSPDALDELAGLLIRQFEPSLSISRDMYQEFVLQRQSASHPHIYQGGMW
jgi:SpoVK/Ycf46/Vps4 family AAA+-type ATPase